MQEQRSQTHWATLISTRIAVVSLMKMQSRLDDDLLSDGASFKLGSLSYARAQESPYWNIFFLAIAWALTLTTSTLLTSVGPLTAKDLGASSSIAAFTVGCFLIGAAVSSVPSGAIFRKYGRMAGFSMGCMFQFFGSALGALAIIARLLPVLFLGCFSIGLGQGLGQFYRFSAVEVSPDYLKSRAVTYVLSGGIIAAFLGPTTANYSATLMSPDYLASFILIAAIALLNQITVLFVNFPPPVVPKQIVTADVPNALVTSALAEQAARNPSEVSSTGANSSNNSGRLVNVVDNRESLSVKIRSAKEIVSQPMFMVACTVATLAHTIMVMIMSNVSLAMDNSGFAFHNTSLTLEVHFLAMFSPGFFTGSLIEKFGTLSVALLGALVFGASSFVLASGDSLWNYTLGMVLSGLGWNFAFSAGTVMLTSCYKPIEAAEVQAYNDFIIFSVAGAGSLISGVLYAAYGWLVLIYIVSGLIAIYLALFTIMWKYAPADEEEEEDDDCCSLLSTPQAHSPPTGEHFNVTISHAPAGSFSGNDPHNREISSDPEASLGGMMFGAGRNMSFDTRPTVGGSIAASSALNSGQSRYDINSRNSSVSSTHSNRSARKNSIAEVGLRVSFA